MANGDIIKLGTFYLNNVKQALPTNPYNGTPTGASAAGNVPAYSSGNIEIRDTDASAAYQIQWVEVNIDGKKLLVADRALLATVSWDALNTQNLIFGKEITISGQRYKLRVLTGGTGFRTGTDQYSGGTPTNNEWDRIITNESAFSGLPTPTATDLDSTQNATDFNGTHNTKWHWYYMYSWCQETYSGNSATRAFRGYSSARFWNYATSSYATASIGWRPCLEVLNSAPVISDTNRDLGSLTAAPSVPYTVSEADGDTFSILEVVDSTTIRSLTNQSAGSFTLAIPSGTWAALSNGSHTLSVTATDPEGLAAVRTYTFTKTNTAPGAPTINSPTANARIPASGYVTFTPAADAEGDTQTLKLQIAANSGFTTTLQEFTSGLQKYEGGSWVNVSNAVAADIGKQFRIPYSGVALNGTRYIRVVTSDANASTNSAAVAVKTGNVLDIQTKPESRADMPSNVKVMLDATIDSAATLQILVCNNCNDSSPAWEDCTTAYQNNTMYAFTNTAKTATSWGVAIRIIINANNAAGEISVSAIGLGVS
ncbi:MAG: hypothetical protein LBN00_06190 [Oscillospiraceae bacterium]|jgi:hypothetical protein|nr:hypothetical protein [Oscillospiraceae bacterium]